MSNRKRKNRRKQTKGRHIISTKPKFGYYLLMIFFPLMFFLVDNSFDIFKNKWGFNEATLIDLGCIFFFFTVPLIIFFSRRTVKLFEDRIIIHWPSLNKSKEYRIEQLKKWEYLDFYVQNAGQQKYLHLWFHNSRKISIHGLESNKLKRLVDYFEITHGDKKIHRESLAARVAIWIKNKITGPNN